MEHRMTSVSLSRRIASGSETGGSWSRRLVAASRRRPYREALTSTVPARSEPDPPRHLSSSRHVEEHHEAPVPAKCAQTSEEARLPLAHEHPGRPSRAPGPSPEGSSPALGVIERLSGRTAFDRLAREGVRTGRGPIRLVSRLDATQSARIGFSIPRSVGSAVVRNRIRRRLRAVLHELCRESPEFPARGDHLIRVTAPIDDWSHATLRRTLQQLLS